MAIFKPVEKFKFENSTLDIAIDNVYVANDHFGSTDDIIEFISKLDISLYEQADKPEILTINLFNFLNPFPRIKKVEFYIDKIKNPEPEFKDWQYWNILIVSDMLEFNNTTDFGRYIKGSFRGHKLVLSLIELYKSEYKLLKDKKENFPESWEYQSKITSRFNKLKVVLNG